MHVCALLLQRRSEPIILQLSINFLLDQLVFKTPILLITRYALKHFTDWIPQREFNFNRSTDFSSILFSKTTLRTRALILFTMKTYLIWLKNIYECLIRCYFRKKNKKALQLNSSSSFSIIFDEICGIREHTEMINIV